MSLTSDSILVSLGYKIKYHRLGGLSSRHLFLTVMEARSPRARCWQIWLLVKALFLAGRWPASLCVLKWQREETLVSLPHLIRALIQNHVGFTLVTPSEPNYLPKASLPYTITLGVRDSVYEL